MKKILCILVAFVSASAGWDSHSDSSSHEWEGISSCDGNYIAEYVDEVTDQWSYDDSWNQGYEEESWGFPDFGFSSASRISISCFLHGNDGCQTKCNLQCTLYDCQPQTSCCDDDFHCLCDEVYDLGSDQLSQSDFEFLNFNELWTKHFEVSIFSKAIRQNIRDDPRIEKYILSLLRNPHVSGDDIISILNDKYPHWDDLFFLKSNKHLVKTKLLGAGKPIKYEDITDHIDELYVLMDTKPVGNVDKVKYRRRIRKFLQKITNIDDLEELLHLIKLSGKEKLYQLAKSILKNLGYGFEEDGEKAGKMGLLRNLAGELADADEDEIMEIATLNKFMSQPSVNEDIKSPSVGEKLYQSEEISTKVTTNQQPVPFISNLEQNVFTVPPIPVVSSFNVADSSIGQILPSMPTLDETTSYISQMSAPGASSVTTDSGSSMSANSKIMSSLSTGQTIPGTQINDLGHRLYYIVVDENGKVSQANVVPKIPFMIPGSMSINPQRNSSSQDTASSNNSQTNTSSWYSLPPYPFGYIPPYTSGSAPPPGPPPSFSMSPPAPYMHGLPYPYPYAPPPFSHPAPPPCPPQTRSVGGGGCTNAG